MNNSELLQQGVWGFMATSGFAVLFNVPLRALPICGFTGAMGHMWRRALLANGAHPVVAAFVGALIVGFLGYSQARFFRMPRLIFTVTGIISMIPGVPAFETVVYFVRGDYSTGLESAILAGLVVAAIAGGLVTARLLATLGDTVSVHRTILGQWARDITRPTARIDEE